MFQTLALLTCAQMLLAVDLDETLGAGHIHSQTTVPFAAISLHAYNL
jgi:hypothetical protein